MGRISMILMAAAALLCAGLYTACAESATRGDQPGAVEASVVDAGNRICPVSGDKVDGVNTYVYKGKSYNLCCHMCKGIFAGDPEKYSAIAEKEISGK